MAKSTSVRFISAAVAAKAAGKLACPTIEQPLADEVWAEFKHQVEHPDLNQRPHEDQVKAGKWNHLKTVVSTQATLEVAEVVYVGGRGRRKTKRFLLDGYHRLFYWFCVSPDGCPFYQLNLVVHRIEVPHDTYEDDVEEMVDELARTINSKQSVKRNQDFLTAAIREAVGKGAKPKSKAYRLGTGAVSYLKRVIGNPSQLSGPRLKAAVLKELDTHMMMDELFHFVENNANVKRYITRVFHTGITSAMFVAISRIPTASGKKYAIEQIRVALEHATSAIGGAASKVPKKKWLMAVVDVLCELANPKVDANLRAEGGNREGFYSKVAEYMSDELDGLVKVGSRF